MRRATVLAAVMMLAGCSATSEDRAVSNAEASSEETAQPDQMGEFIALLEKGDSLACAHQSVADWNRRMVHEGYPYQQAYKDLGITPEEYDQVPVEPIFKDVVLSNINRDISQVTCQGTSNDGRFNATLYLQPKADKTDVMFSGDGGMRWAVLLAQGNFRKAITALRPPAPQRTTEPAGNVVPPAPGRTPEVSRNNNSALDAPAAASEAAKPM